MHELEMIARQLVAPGKGLLAADESVPSIAKHFGSLGIPSTEATRLAYRDMLFTSPALEEYLSGAILFDETIRQKRHNGTSFTQVLERRGILPGIKVDKGVVHPRPDSGAGRRTDIRSAGWRTLLALDQGLRHDVEALEDSVFLLTIGWPGRTE